MPQVSSSVASVATEATGKFVSTFAGVVFPADPRCWARFTQSDLDVLPAHWLASLTHSRSVFQLRCITHACVHSHAMSLPPLSHTPVHPHLLQASHPHTPQCGAVWLQPASHPTGRPLSKAGGDRQHPPQPHQQQQQRHGWQQRTAARRRADSDATGLC